MYNHILIPIDSSINSEQTARWGLNFAKVLGADVTLLHVLEYTVATKYGMPTGARYAHALSQAMQDAGNELLEGMKAQATALGVPCETCMVENDSPFQAILRLEDTHDLTIMATHRRKGLDRLFLGSVTEAVLRRSSKPHLILRYPDGDMPDHTHVPTSFEHFFLSIDGSDCSYHTLGEGLRLAKALGAKVTFLHTLEVPLTVHTLHDSGTYQPSIHEDMRKAAQELLDKALERATRLGVEATAQLVDKGAVRPNVAILDAAASASITIIGTHGRCGFERTSLGSVTARVLQQSSAPHLVLPYPQA